jgi:hypothetical protein
MHMEVAGGNPGITVNGVNYPFPTLDTITLDEEQILHDHADVVVRDFIMAHPDTTDEEKLAYRRLQMLKLREPALKRALTYVALKRRHAEMSHDDLYAMSGQANALEVDIAMLWGDDEDPTPTSQTQPESKRSTSEPSSQTESGRSTQSGLGTAAEILGPIGITGLDTSSPGAPPTVLAS